MGAAIVMPPNLYLFVYLQSEVNFAKTLCTQPVMRNIALLLMILTGVCQHVSGQYAYPHAEDGRGLWPRREWRTANTARFAWYMPKQVRESIRLMNLSRMYGERFAQIYIEPIPDKTTYEQSLTKALAKKGGREPLRPSLNLWASATVHAAVSGVTNKKVNSDFENRILFFNPMGHGLEMGENTRYGAQRAIDVVLELLIDSGVPSLGHRKNILNPYFARVGGARFNLSGTGPNTVFYYSSANLKDLLFFRKPDNEQMGLNLEFSNIGTRPTAGMGLAYYANHLGTDLFCDVSYHHAIMENRPEALSAHLSHGSSTGLVGNFALGAKVFAFAPSDNPNVYLQPTFSWFVLANFFRDGYFVDFNETKKSAVYRLSYGYNFRLSGTPADGAVRHCVTLSRFVHVASVNGKKRKAR